MSNPERQIVHHLTTELGAIQVTETPFDVRMDFDNTATNINMTVDRWHNRQMIVETVVYAFETPNMSVKYTRLDDTVIEKYRDLVIVSFRDETETETRNSTFYFYVNPEIFRQAVAAMEQEAIPEPHEGMIDDDK